MTFPLFLETTHYQDTPDSGLADAYFVSWPEGSCGIVADYWLGVALYFYDCGGLVGGLEWEAG